MIETRSLVRQQDGTWLFVPGGRDNAFARRCYVVGDDAAAERLRPAVRNLERVESTVLMLLVALVAALGWWRPWNISYGPLAALVLAGPLVLRPIPVFVGARIARRFGLPERPTPRTLSEALAPMRERIGPGWLLAVIVVFSLAALAIVVAIGTGAHGDSNAGLLAGLIIVPAFAILPLQLYAARARRLAAANARLEALVGERTAELARANAALEARVAEQVARLERLGHLRHFFAAPVAELILGQSGFDPARVHRKELSVVSIDLRGFTTFAEAAEPEEVIAVLRRYHAVLGQLVNRHQATLEHFAGENAMVFLNDPLELPDHPARAVKLALELREQVQPLLEEWRREGHDFGLASGIATGYATIGTVGYEGRWEYAAIGSVCNLAARLCAEAQPGQVVTTYRVLSRAGGGARTEPLGELAMKGISRPVAGFNVLSLA